MSYSRVDETSFPIRITCVGKRESFVWGKRMYVYVCVERKIGV